MSTLAQPPRRTKRGVLRRIVLSPTAVAGGLALAPRLPYIDNHLYLDMSVFMTVGAGLSHGVLPYRDVFDHKAPLTYTLYAAMDAVAPASAIGVRLLGFCFALAALALLVSLVRRHAGEGAVWVAAIVFALAVSSEVFGLEPETEQLALPLLGAAVLLADRFGLTGSLPAAAGAGAALGAAIMLKPTFGLLLVLLLALVLAGGRRRAAAIVVLAVAAAAAVAVSVAPYVAAGALDDLKAGMIDYNQRYVSAAGERLGAAGLREKVDWLRDVPALPFLALGLAGAAYSVWARRRVRLALISLAWALLMLVAAKLGIRGIAEYYVTVAPAAAIGVALGAEAVVDGLRDGERAARLAVYGLAVVPIAVALLVVPLGKPEQARLQDEPIEFPLGDGLASDAAAIARVDLEEVASRVRAATAPSGRIYVACDECQSVYWLARRWPASRWIFPGIMVPRPAYEAVGSDLRRSPPTAVVTFAGVRSDYLQEAISRLALVAEGDGYRIYARRPGAAALTPRRR